MSVSPFECKVVGDVGDVVRLEILKFAPKRISEFQA